LGPGGESVGQVFSSAMQQPTPRPEPHECVLAGAQLPPAHDDGERPTHAPPFTSHCHLHV
jgi:hypothetical protein